MKQLFLLVSFIFFPMLASASSSGDYDTIIQNELRGGRKVKKPKKKSQTTYAVAYGSEIRYEREGATQDIIEKTATALSFGRFRPRWSYWSDLSFFSEESGSPGFSIKRDRYDLAYSLRFHPLNLNDWRPYIGGGVLLSYESLTTSLFQESRHDTSGYELGWMGSIGLWGRFAKIVGAGIEARFLTGALMDPNPLTSLTFRLGLEF